MAKITLNNLTTNYGSQALFNANSDTIEDHLNNKVLYRDNPSGEPNTMENELDMNSNRIINLAAGVLNSDAVTVAQLNAIISGGSSTPVVSQSRETQLGEDAVARVFTLAGLSYTVGANVLAVYRNGQRLERTEDYSETSSSSVTLTFDPNDSDRFVFITNDVGTSEVTTTDAITHAGENLNDLLVESLPTSTTWTPTITFATSGDLSVTYSHNVGLYTKIGRKVSASFSILTSTFTHTTASGDLRISGLPFSAVTLTNMVFTGPCRVSGVTKAGYTNFNTSIQSGNSYSRVASSGSGVAYSTVQAADMPTAGTVLLEGVVEYETVD